MTTGPRVLVLDIETQRAVVETFSLYKPFIHIDRVIRPSRILCFGARWWSPDGRDKDTVIFQSAWDDDDDEGYTRMMRKAWQLVDEADLIVTWNGDRFDNQWFNSEFIRLGFRRPAPSKSVDLIKVLKKHFKQGLLSMKLDWSARQLLGDKKTPHGGSDLWHDIRYGSTRQKRAAQSLMKKYCNKDVELTADLLDKYLPWVNGLNMALYHDNDDDLMHCTKCNSVELIKDGVKSYRTAAGSYQIWRCKDCGATNRGKRVIATTELRPT